MSSQPQRGFTLIELLTVIAIIGILAGILIASIGPIRERMNAQECMSQMRRLGQATLLYQADNGGFLPPNNAYSGSSEKDTWTMVLRPYLDVVDGKTYGGGTKLMTEYLTCPSVKEDAEKPANWWESNYAAGLCFGTNGTRRRTLSQDTTKTMLFIENKNRSTRSLAITPPPWDSVGYRHSEHTNCVYLDGHVQRLTEEEIPHSLTNVFWGSQN